MGAHCVLVLFSMLLVDTSGSATSFSMSSSFLCPYGNILNSSLDILDDNVELIFCLLPSLPKYLASRMIPDIQKGRDPRKLLSSETEPHLQLSPHLSATSTQCDGRHGLRIPTASAMTRIVYHGQILSMRQTGNTSRIPRFMSQRFYLQRASQQHTSFPGDSINPIFAASQILDT